MKTKKWCVAIVLVFVIASILYLFEQRTKVIRHFLDDVVYDNYNHYLPCSRWPTEEDVRRILNDHDGLLQDIEAVNPGNVGIEVDNSTCPGKADLVIWYASHSDRESIEAYLSDELLFFGIPVRLSNR